MRGVGFLSVAAVTVGLALACGGESSPDTPAPEATPTVAPPAPVRTLPPAPPTKDPERPDDCTLAVERLEARFLPDQLGGAKVDVVHGDNGIVESFVMADGTPVRSDYGGCYHVGMTETYMLAAPPTDVLAAAREVMSKVARVPGSDSLVDALKKAKTLDEDGSWDCGEFNTCNATAEGALLTVGFSFAM